MAGLSTALRRQLARIHAVLAPRKQGAVSVAVMAVALAVCVINFPSPSVAATVSADRLGSRAVTAQASVPQVQARPDSFFRGIAGQAVQERAMQAALLAREHAGHVAHLHHLAVLATRQQQAQELASQRAAQQSKPKAPSAAGSSPAPGGGGYAVTSAFQACVIRAESGGNPDIWNASGHWGLYQFSASTWALHGGDPALFGKASAAYQTQVFWNTYNADGTSDWAPYDGC